MEQDIILKGLADEAASLVKSDGGNKLKVNGEGNGPTMQKLLKYLPFLPKEVQEGIRSGNASVYSTSIFDVQRPLSNSDKLTNPSLPKTAGVTNIDNGKFAEGEYFLAFGFRMLYNDSAATSFATINNLTDLFDTICPNDILLSTVEIQKNESPIQRTAVAEMFSQVYGYGVNKQMGFVEFDNPKFFKSGDKYSAKLIDRPTLAGTAGSCWTYSALYGIMIKL